MRDRGTSTQKTANRPVKLALSQFDASLLSDEISLEVAVGVLEGYFDDPTLNVEALVRDLATISHLFECMFSVISEGTAARIKNWAINTFPDTAAGYLNSATRILLDRISLYLLFLPYPTSSDEPGNLRDCRRYVELAQPVLNSLARFVFTEDESVLGYQTTPDEPIATKRKVQRPARLERHIVKQSRLDSRLFDNLGLGVPRSQDEATAVILSIFDRQKSILNYYLDILRYPHLRELFKAVYIRKGAIVNDANGTSTVPTPTESMANRTVIMQGAFPMVQPMKAALYFDSVDGFGEWRILISTRADRDLRHLRKKNIELLKIVVKKVKQLSNGHFSNDNQKQLNDTATDIPIYEAKMTRDSRLVYFIDCVPEYESNVERQVVKIFGIYSHNELDRRFWDGVGRQLARRGQEYRRRCIIRLRPKGIHSDIVFPASFPSASVEQAGPQNPGLPDLHQGDLEKLHEMLVLEKYVTFSQALINSILANQEVAHVFDVSPLEKQIIKHPSSCYVLGRSGTGKTTTMLFKMLGIERSWRSYEQMLPKPRQIFVTQSRILVEKVQEYFFKLYESLATAEKSAREIRRIAAIRQSQQDQGLVDIDDEFEWRGDTTLPQKFKDLQDEHFPIFLTSNQLFRLLESEYGLQDSLIQAKLQLNPVQEYGNNKSVSNDYMQQRRSAFVSYGVFLESYWPHFPQPWTKGLDPALVFGEFMGVIKGSEQTLYSPNGYLDRETYLSLSHRTQGTFANHRDMIYDLFTAYLKRKRTRGEYDAADRTHAIIEAMRKKGTPGKLVDFIYVDEAQDNLLIDAFVLRSICQNPGTGLFWAGDTAQTISIGSAFRFDDLKAFLYRIETNGNSPLSERHAKPQTFHLSVNYRSHAGIVDCARTVVELITLFWPHAIDTLNPERGIVEGIKPVFFSGWNTDLARYEQFLFGKTGSQIEFGADQCILVRNETARDTLRAQVGDIGLIMTLYESKGLEFNDVLLYNFFADSTVDRSQWRIILDAPGFADARHNGVCRDLKFLYVAITRARKNLWIADSSDKGEPMRMFWTANNLIHNSTPGTDIPSLAMSSTPEEWAKKARELFRNKRWMQAAHCYERAHMHREMAAAHAYHLREKARLVPSSSASIRTTAYVTAAKAFSACACESSMEKRIYFRIAAECYAITGDYRNTAQAYYNAAEFTLSAQNFRKAGMFDEAINIIKNHRSAMDENVTGGIVDVVRLEYLRKSRIAKARDLFESDEDMLEYMEDCGLDTARAIFLTELGRYTDAAELHLQEGRTLDAIRSFLKDQHPTAVLRASRCLLDGLWYSLSLGVTPRSTIAAGNPEVSGLLENLAAMTVNNISDSEHGETTDEILMFKAIAADDLPTLRRLGQQFHQRHKNDAAALLCFHYVFSTMPKIQVSLAGEVADVLQLFSLYAKLLQKFSSDPSPSYSSGIRRLFGVELVTEDSLRIHRYSFLYLQCNPRLTPTSRVTERGILISRGDLEKLLRHVLCAWLRSKVFEENKLCHEVRAFTLCMSFIAFGRCNRGGCPLQHISSQDYDNAAYNLRIRLHLLQISIYSTVCAVVDHQQQEQEREEHRYWLQQLHETLEPPFYKMGSPHNLKAALIPELRQGLQTVRSWTIDWLYSLNPSGSNIPAFLTSIIRTFSLIFTFDPSAVDSHVPRVPCITISRPSQLMRKLGPDETYIVHDLLAFLKDDRRTSLSRGILFAFHIINNRIPVDVGVLCNFLDHLCASLVFYYRLRGSNGLHDITLPRRWLANLVADVSEREERDTGRMGLYVRPMGALLEQIYTGGEHADHLLFERKSLATLGWQVKSVFITRICQNLCLLGYNTRASWLRDEIWQAITSIYKPNRDYDRSYERYVTARSWEGLARTVRRSVGGSTLDEMVHIYAADLAPKNFIRFPGIKYIIYQSLGDLPALLASESQAVSGSCAQLNIEITTSTLVDSQHPEHIMESADIHHDEEDSVEADADEAQLDEDDIAPSLDNIEPSIIDPPIKILEYSQQELHAADIILKAYRRYLRWRKAIECQSPMQSMRRRIFASFHNASAGRAWPCRFYKMLYQGPIPHLVVCIDCAREYFYAEKEQTKKHIRQAKHLELEEVRARQTAISKSLKEAIRLQKELRFDSELHIRRDLDALQARTMEVEKLISQLPVGEMKKCEEDLTMAMVAIVRPNEPPSVKKPKPTLILGDELDVEFKP